MLKHIKWLSHDFLFTKADRIIKINKSRSIENADLIEFEPQDIRVNQSYDDLTLKIGTPIQFIIQLLMLHRAIIAKCFSWSCLGVLRTKLKKLGFQI